MLDLAGRHRRKPPQLTCFDRAHRQAHVPFDRSAGGHELVPRHVLADAHGGHPKGERLRSPKPVLGLLGGVAFGLTIGHVDDIDRNCAESGRYIWKRVVGGVGVEVRRGHKHWPEHRPGTARRQDQRAGYQQEKCRALPRARSGHYPLRGPARPRPQRRVVPVVTRRLGKQGACH